MSTTPVTTSPLCPACAARSAVTELRDGAALDGHGCPRCGGVLLPSTGSERLLHDELALDRAMLIEIAQNFGGRRYTCPACRSKMSSLLVRGVDIDLCFHCAALWLDAGEIERLSAGRYRSTRRSLATTYTGTSTDAMATTPPDSVVRLDARHPVRQGATAVLGWGVLLAAVAWLRGDYGDAPIAIGITLVGLAVINMRPTVVDVFPRARRLLRSHRWLAGEPRDARAEQLDDERFVIVRQIIIGSEISLVDGAGRRLVLIQWQERYSPIDAAVVYARRLGAVMLLHPRIADADHPAATTTINAAWAPTKESTVTFRRRTTSATQWQFVGTIDGTPRLTLTSAVPARGDEGANERLALCFHLDLDGVVVARLHDDQRGHTVFVGTNGEALASLHRRRFAGAQWHTIARAKTAHRLHLIAPPLSSEMWIIDDHGSRHASIVQRDDALVLTTRQNTNDDALLVLLLFLQAVVFSDTRKS